MVFLIVFLQRCALRSQDFAACNREYINDLKIRTGAETADPHSVGTRDGKAQVCSMQFTVYGNFPDSYKNRIQNSQGMFKPYTTCL